MNLIAVTYKPNECKMTVLLGALAAFAPLAIDLYLPALPAIASGLAATPDAVQLSVSGRPMAIVIVVTASTSMLGQVVYRKNALRGVADGGHSEIRI